MLSLMSFASIADPINRVLLLTKSKPLVGLIGILSFLGFVFGLYAGIRSGIISKYVHDQNVALLYNSTCL